MGLREIANTDLGNILHDKTTGFGWDIVLTSPDEVVQSLVGFSDDIGFNYDPDTGTMISSRQASAVIYNKDVTTLPVGINNNSKKPWLVSFFDIDGKQHYFKVVSTKPDLALGCTILELEAWQV